MGTSGVLASACRTRMLEVHLHPAVSPSAPFGEPVDHGGGLRIERRVTYVFGPDGARRKVWGKRNRVGQFRPPDVDDVVVKRKASDDGSNSQH